jgi:hypothetical protein
MTVVDDGPEPAENPETVAAQEKNEGAGDPKEVNENSKTYNRYDSIHSEKTMKMSNRNEHEGDRSTINTRRLMESPAFCCCRCIHNIPDTSPRCFSICVVVILPLWFLVLVSVVSGHFLARMEAPLEVESNDARLASRASVVFELNNTDGIINGLPRFCFDAYLDRDIIDRDNILDFLPPDKNTTFEDAWDYFQGDLAEFMNNCTEADQEIVDEVFTVLTQFTNYQFSQLTFDWIRCLNKTAIPARKLLLKPSDAERDAVKLVNQTIYYSTTWEQQRQAYYQEYLGDNLYPTLEERSKAFQYSISLATGDEDCDPNYEGTAWFWFTVMTTVGK